MSANSSSQLADGVVAVQAPTSGNCAVMRLGELIAKCDEQSTLQSGEPCSCDCGAVLNAASASAGACEFCSRALPDDFDEHEALSSDDAYYITTPPLAVAAQQQQQQPARPLVLFAVDISGSMSVTTQVNGKHVSRLDCMKQALCAQIKKLSEEEPECKVGVLTFGSVVTFDNGLRKRQLPSSVYQDFARLTKLGGELTASLQCVGTAAGSLLNTVSQLKTSGCTALGPAVAAAVGCAAKLSGAAVVLATDGAANTGCGSGRDLPFYTAAAQFAKRHGTMISTLTVDGEEVGLEQLGLLSDVTNGRVDIVDPADMSDVVGAMLERKTLATAVHATVVGCARIALLGGKEPHVRRFDVGTASTDADVAVRFVPTDAARTAVADALTAAAAAAAAAAGDAPACVEARVQLQLSFTLASGEQRMRVVTRRVPLSADRVDCEAAMRGDVLALETLQRAAAHAHARDYKASRVALISAQRTLQRAMANGIGDELATAYLGFVQHAEKLDGFMREAETLAAVAVAPSAGAQRDDDASQSILQTKSLSLRELLAA
eukprot:TRINITY_DN233_c0_g1_i1.p1 TRINITY_DN233_c0_g1~~TRINITY_DN233_c0_g1_i1.p1  ORF type:complete len:570 (+),score=353.08 TRINITY_DN233_c0_g1_i1:68-1711(+)